MEVVHVDECLPHILLLFSFTQAARAVPRPCCFFKCTTASGPLHLSFLLPVILFLQILACKFLKSQLRGHLFSKALADCFL